MAATERRLRQRQLFLPFLVGVAAALLVPRLIMVVNPDAGMALFLYVGLPVAGIAVVIGAGWLLLYSAIRVATQASYGERSERTPET